MAFTRKFLVDNGVPEDKVDAIMAERNRTLGDYIPKDDVQAQIDAALAEHKADPVDPKTTDEYKALMMENNKLKAFATDEFATVKAPYRDIVWGKLEHGANHKPYAEQMEAIKTEMPDLFAVEQQDGGKNTPQYSQTPGRDTTNPTSDEDKLYQQLSEAWGK